MKKIFSLFAAVLMAGSMMAGVLVEYNGTATLPAGVTISGTTKMANVKIHTNTDGVDCIQLANGYTTDGLFNGNAITLHNVGGFKAGDTLKVAGFFNNADDTKVAKAEVFTVNAELGCTAVWTSNQFVNGRLVNDEPVLEAYVLAADMDSIMIGRNGGTGTNLKYIAVVRPEAAPAKLGTFSISSAEIVAGQVGDIALGTNGYGSQAVDNPATWYTCAKGDYTFKGAKVCVATIANGGGLQMQGNASDVAKMGFFGNATAFNNIHSLKIVLRIASTATYAPVFNVYTDSLGTTTALAAPDTVTTTEGGFKKFVYTYEYAEPGKFFNIKDDLAGALYIDSIYVIYEKEEDPAPSTYNVNFTVVGEVEGETVVGASWNTPDFENRGQLVVGDNTVNEGYIIQISVTTPVNYDAELKVNGEVVTMEFVLGGMRIWQSTLSGDLTIVLTIIAPEPTKYYFKHPWNGGDWTWKEAADTTFLDIEASYVVAQWGDNGFNFNTEAADAGATWYEKEVIGTITPDGTPAIGYPAKGTEVTFICLHEDHTHAVGGGRAWIVYEPATAIENTTDVKIIKTIENGQVVIIKNGVRYNAVGAKL